MAINFKLHLTRNIQFFSITFYMHLLGIFFDKIWEGLCEILANLGEI